MTTLTPEVLANMRADANLGVVTWKPATLLALLDRIEVLETALTTVGPEFMDAANRASRRLAALDVEDREAVRNGGDR